MKLEPLNEIQRDRLHITKYGLFPKLDKPTDIPKMRLLIHEVFSFTKTRIKNETD